jgi:Pyridoxamine 5'-phosphate oxidase
MPDRQPKETRNLDIYGRPALLWETAHDLLQNGPKGPRAGFFLATVDADGRPHVAGVGVVWHDGDLYFTSGPRTRKARNLKRNPACSLAVNHPGMDLTLEGEATKVTDPVTLEAVAGIYRELGWPATVEGDAFTASFSAPSAGPPPWDLYRVTYSWVVGLNTAGEDGATLWQFDPD